MARRGWLLLLLTLSLWLPLSAADDAEETAAAKNAAMLQRLKDNAAARRAATQRIGARRAAVRVSAQQAGDLDVDKLNAMLANEALRGRRLGAGSGAAGAAVGRRVASAARGTAASSPLAAGTTTARANASVAAPANANNANIARRAALANGGRGGARRGYDFAFPASSSRGGQTGLSRMDRAAVQKAVEAALDKHEAESFTGRLRQWLRKLVPMAEKTASVASAAAALR